MKTYQCHKKVQAFKIVGVSILKNSSILRGQEGEEAIISDLWGPQDKSTSQLIGGYYVRYGDDYSSWSPAEAFEAGYTVMSDDKITITDKDKVGPKGTN